MLRRLVQIFVLVPIAVLLVAFSLANRHAVTVSLDPFGMAPGLAFSLPLFLLLFLVLLAGLLIGGIAAWLRQAHWRRQARREHREAEHWRGRAEAAARDTGSQPLALVPARDER